jgi:outer membrane receptor protein involved in Fe transport
MTLAVDSGDGVVIFPNPALSSEYSYNGELGIERGFGERFTTGGTTYYSQLADAVVISDAQFNGQDSILYDGTMSKVKSLQNVGAAYLTGFDFYARANVSAEWSASTLLSYGAGRDRNDLPCEPSPCSARPVCVTKLSSGAKLRALQRLETGRDIPPAAKSQSYSDGALMVDLTGSVSPCKPNSGAPKYLRSPLLLWPGINPGQLIVRPRANLIGACAGRSGANRPLAATETCPASLS